MTRKEYVQLNVQEQLHDEGSAQLNSARVRDEIRKSGGPDIGIPGSQTAAYQKVYSDYKSGKISRQQAIDRNANLMGKETTSGTNQNYRKYYGESYEKYWDSKAASKGKK